MNKITDRPKILELKSLKFLPISQDLGVNLQNRHILGRAICGPACVAMIINYFGKYPGNKKIQNIEWLVALINSLHSNGVASVKQKFSLDGKPSWITVGPADQVKLEKNQKIFGSDNAYCPAFSLIRGYDHRISQQLFTSFGLRAGFFENENIDSIKSRLKSGEILILSITPRRQLLVKTQQHPSQASHLVVVSDYDTRRDRFYIIDPDYDIKKGLLPKYEMRAGDLAKICNYKGTWVESVK